MEYTLIRSSRRTLAVEITRDGELVVRAPQLCPQTRIDRFLESRADWIRHHLRRAHEHINAHPEPDEAGRRALISEANRLLPELTEHFAGIMGLQPAGVRITGAKTRFGSCSAKNSICYSWRLMLYPRPAIEYVVVHELAHIVRKDHSRQFYELVASVLPDWKSRRALLKK